MGRALHSFQLAARCVGLFDTPFYPNCVQQTICGTCLFMNLTVRLLLRLTTSPTGNASDSRSQHRAGIDAILAHPAADRPYRRYQRSSTYCRPNRIRESVERTQLACRNSRRQRSPPLFSLTVPPAFDGFPHYVDYRFWAHWQSTQRSRARSSIITSSACCALLRNAGSILARPRPANRANHDKAWKPIR